MALHVSFKKALEGAGLPKHHSIHNARHTYAIHLLAETNNLEYVQKQLGHYDLAFTAAYMGDFPDPDKTLADNSPI